MAQLLAATSLCLHMDKLVAGAAKTHRHSRPATGSPCATCTPQSSVRSHFAKEHRAARSKTLNCSIAVALLTA
ncbi:hypothetical protein PF005_g25637 [Phytophthora fragariae]|uniref:Uncharacterized protein n=1 Tax=Phytophthora fragariae TaxID=53985 RepID=A0A6A3R8P3_9STRA|nr:hypothetical protein PF003_g12032 [Phytophthora fragariae]KAE8923353.1 hypothetical protein PF009_g26396 [Phytophthora fragariae]KAE9072007.1 hypothetical protein PF010_g25656 [Phytophthora fragariae]KAE9072419.1 hypothetical protein PF007_g26186 [Phytophthora fragariae]KAE9088573.1 hypothetical protein PF006_g25549 [Phytophthora fragariae]